MADPLTLAVGAMATGTLVSGFSQNAAMQSEAKRLNYEARGYELRGKQVAAETRRDLNSSLSTIAAIRASRGLGAGPTARAIRDEEIRSAARNENSSVLSEKTAASSSRAAAASKRSAGRMSLLSSAFMSAGQALPAFE